MFKKMKLFYMIVGGSSMPLPKETTYTIEDIYNLPDGQRAELIDGEIYMMSPPSATHQRISGFLQWAVTDYIRKKKGGCEIFAAPFAVFLKNDDNNYLEPDLTIVCDKDKIDEKGCHGAPDWVVEIVSSSSKRMDYYKKLNLYQEAGVREYWIVDPLKKIILVYNLEDADAPTMYRLTDKIKVNIYDDFEIDMSEM